MIESFSLNYHRFVFDQEEQILPSLCHLIESMMAVEDILYKQNETKNHLFLLDK